MKIMYHQEIMIRSMRAENLILSRRVFNRERKGGKKRPRTTDYTPKAGKVPIFRKRMLQDDDNLEESVAKMIKHEPKSPLKPKKLNFGKL